MESGTPCGWLCLFLKVYVRQIDWNIWNRRSQRQINEVNYFCRRSNCYPLYHFFNNRFNIYASVCSYSTNLKQNLEYDHLVTCAKLYNIISKVNWKLILYYLTAHYYIILRIQNTNIRNKIRKPYISVASPKTSHRDLDYVITLIRRCHRLTDRLSRE